MWNANYPATVRYRFDLKVYGWSYTHFSQFNESDTLLLVSGYSCLDSQIIVFRVNSGGKSFYSERCRFKYILFTGKLDVLNYNVMTKYGDIFGIWYSDTHFISGQLMLPLQMVSRSVLYLNRAYHDTKPHKFYTRDGRSIRTITVAKQLADEAAGEMNDQKTLGICTPSSGIVLRHSSLYHPVPVQGYRSIFDPKPALIPIIYREKYLIFTTNSETYNFPHQIGFVRIQPFLLSHEIKLAMQRNKFCAESDKVDHLIVTLLEWHFHRTISII